MHLAQITPPCYLCDLARAREKYHQLLSAFRQAFQDVILGYSYKTNYVPLLCQTLHREGAFAEVVSGLEYQLARALGVPHDRIVFNGTGRSDDELAVALEGGAILNLDEFLTRD